MPSCVLFRRLEGGMVDVIPTIALQLTDQRRIFRVRHEDDWKVACGFEPAGCPFDVHQLRLDQVDSSLVYLVSVLLESAEGDEIALPKMNADEGLSSAVAHHEEQQFVDDILNGSAEAEIDANSRPDWILRGQFLDSVRMIELPFAEVSGWDWR